MANDFDLCVTADGVLDAAKRVQTKAVLTPLIENPVLNEIAGGRVFLKAEVLQHCGAFKFRGAFNLISQLSDAEKARGIVAWSSGNHAQGIALAASMAGAKATIVMPEDAPDVKTAMVRRLGAEIVTYDRYNDDREAIGAEIAKRTGAVIAPPFDHPRIIEGQGSVAVETVAQAKAAGQQDLFERIGLDLRNGDQSALFNTNMALINYAAWKDCLEKAEARFGRDALLDAMSPDLIRNQKRQKDNDGVERAYTQFEGAMGSVLLNLDRFWRKEKHDIFFITKAPGECTTC